MEFLDYAPYLALLPMAAMIGYSIWKAMFSTEAKVYALGYGDELDGLPEEDWESATLDRHYRRGRRDARGEMAYQADKAAKRIDREKLRNSK
jgi:hypothetical protein